MKYGWRPSAEALFDAQLSVTDDNDEPRLNVAAVTGML